MENLVKSVSMQSWTVEMRQIEVSFVVSVEDENGMYYSNVFDDFNYATFIFDMKIRQLQGH